MTKPEHQPSTHFVGRWLRSRSNLDWGFGYCKAKRGDAYVLSYVDIPEVAEEEVLVAPQDLVDRPIPKGTRVWVRGKPYGWHAGEIGLPATGGRYQVALVGVPRQMLMYQDQFYLRWSKPLENPAVALEYGLCEAPTIHDARSDLLDVLVRQRQVSRGLSGIISAPVRLYHHQIDTVARVLADPVIRYLLADEVGLGKTIEAGLVVRQVMIDDPAAEVLVLVPSSLLGQWRSELKDRLSLGTALADGRLVVVAHEEISPYWNLDQFALLVIDEAHNLLSRVAEDSATHRALLQVPAMLALSATPMRGEPELFRRLLTLVDPVAFSGTTEESFRRRLHERERSARDLQVLTSKRASVRQKTAVVESIRTMYAGDQNITDLVALCTVSDNPIGPEWFDLAEYVRETYRLSRRMIRHRRDGQLTGGYSVAGRRPTYIEIEDPGRADVDQFLELFRFELTPGRDDVIYCQAVLHALAGPAALHRWLRGRLSLPSTDPKSPPVGARSICESTAGRLEFAGLEARIEAALSVVQDRVNGGAMVVVCSSFRALATAFVERAREEIGEFVVFEHFADIAPHLRDNAVADFLNRGSGAVLVADRSVEEGRNLQEAEVLVNLDLPLDPSRLDQRIGRLDRYAVRPGPAEVVVFTEPASDWVTAQIRLLAEGIGVFDVSVSTVQRLLAQVLQEVLGGLTSQGVGALKVDVEKLRERLDTEREDIDLLEEMESVGAASVFGDEAFAELAEYEDGDNESLRHAMRRLTYGTGSLGIKPVESGDGVVRFSDAKQIGLPEDQVPVLHRLLGAPKTYSREVAADRFGVAPFRIGDPLVDWLEDHLAVDERGRSYAVVRPAAGLSTPTLWLHSEFIVEFNESHLEWDGADRRRLARRGDALLPPAKIATWTDPYGQAPEAVIATHLEPTSEAKRDEVVLRGSTWELVLEALPAWAELIRQSAGQARRVISHSDALAAAIERALSAAHAETAKRNSILRARSLRLPTPNEREAARIELEFEKSAGDALAAGILEPAVRMVSCGVCVLWPEENF